MKRVVFGCVAMCTLMLGIGAASADVNCEQVRRYLKTGRSAEDVAETMVVDLKDVKKCEAQGGQEAAPTPAPKAQP